MFFTFTVSAKDENTKLSSMKAQRIEELLSLPHLNSLKDMAKGFKIPDRKAPPISMEEVRTTANKLKEGDGVIITLRPEKKRMANEPEPYSLVTGVVINEVDPTSDKKYHHVAWLHVISGPDWLPTNVKLALPQDGSLNGGDTPFEYGTPVVVLERGPSEPHESERKIVFSSYPEDDDDQMTTTSSTGTATYLQGNIATFLNGMNPEGSSTEDGEEAPGWKLLTHCPLAVSEARKLQLEVFLTQTFTGLGADPQDKANVISSLEAVKLSISLYIQSNGRLMEVPEWKKALRKHIIVLRSWYHQRHAPGVRKELARQFVTNYQTDPWPKWVTANEFEVYARNQAAQSRGALSYWAEEKRKDKDEDRKKGLQDVRTPRQAPQRMRQKQPPEALHLDAQAKDSSVPKTPIPSGGKIPGGKPDKPGGKPGGKKDKDTKEDF